MFFVIFNYYFYLTQCFGKLFNTIKIINCLLCLLYILVLDNFSVLLKNFLVKKFAQFKKKMYLCTRFRANEKYVKMND